MTPTTLHQRLLILCLLCVSCRILSAQDTLGVAVNRVLVSPRTTSPLYASLSDYVQGRSQRAQNILVAAMEQWQENSFVDASSKFLLALEIVSDPQLNAEKLVVACGYLNAIDDQAFIRQSELLTELYFWRGECARLHSEFGQALFHYDKAIRTSYKGEIRQLALLRIAEIGDRLANYETALAAYENLATTPNNPLALEASLRRAALLYRIARLDSALTELERSKRIFAARTTSSPVVGDVISSPFQEVLAGNQDPSAWYFEFEIPPSEENKKLFVLASTPARIALIEGSTLTEQERFDAALAAFDRGIQYIATTKDSGFVAGERSYYRDGLEFEKAWAYFRKAEYAKSAELFYAIALRDSAQRIAAPPSVRTSRRYADPFYEDLLPTGDEQPITQMNLLDIQLQQLYFNDFPPRARYYAGIAYARAGQSQKGLQLLTELSQNTNIVYSERSSFYQALIEFQNSRMYQAEVLLEPLGMRRTAIGAYSSLLLGDIYYRRASYARAAEYFEFALQYLPETDVTLRSRAQLELGLSLIPLGSWHRASAALQAYLEHADQNTIANDEALFWLGRAFYRADSMQRASKTFERLLREYPNSERFIDAQYTYAWTLLRQGEFQRAATAFADVVKKDTITRYAYDALSRQGDALYALGNLPQALAIYNKAVDRPTFNVFLESRAMFQLGLSRLKSDSSRSAINAFNHIITKLPTSDLLDRAYYNLALAAYAIQLDDRARNAITQLEKDFPASPFAAKGALLVGEEYERNGNDAAALQTYRRILTTYAGSEAFEPALFDAIELLARTKKYDDALEIANRYLDGKELSTTTRSRLTIRKAELQLEAAKPHNAVTTMKAFIADNPNDPFIPNANYTLGKAYGAAGDIDNSVAQFQHVIATYPESDAAPYSYLQLARTEVKRQNNDAAARYYMQAYDWKYYSSDAAPIAMAEYGAFVRNTLTLPDSAIKIYSDLTSRYLIETSAGTNAQLEVVDMLLESDRTSEAVSRLETIATARKGERAGGEARLKLASLYRRQSQWKKALAEYDKARRENTITNDQLGRSLTGSAEMHYALGDKRSTRIVAQELLNKRGLSRQYRLQAEQLIAKISPKKKKGKR